MRDEALKLALEALELNTSEWKSLADSGDCGFWRAEDQNHYKQTKEAITAIKAALAAPVHKSMARIEAKTDTDCAYAYADGWNACVEHHKNIAHAAQPAVPDAITDRSESPEYIQGFNDCRQAMLAA